MTPALARMPMHLSALLACFMVCAPAIADDIARVTQRILSHPNGELRCTELDGAMASLDTAGQADLLRRLMRDGDPPMAAQAFVLLVQRDAVDDATRDVLDLEIRDWVPGLQLSAISAIGSVPDPEERRRFAEVVRAATEVALHRNAAQADREHITLVDWSLIALSRMDDPHSIADAKAAIQRMPASSGAWIVLLQRNAIGDEELAIAQGILDDEARPVPLRVLAAIALGGSHPTARDYVASVVNGTVDQFGESTLREIMIASMGAPDGGLLLGWSGPPMPCEP